MQYLLIVMDLVCPRGRGTDGSHYIFTQSSVVMGQNFVHLRVALQPPSPPGPHPCRVHYSPGSSIDGHLVAQVAVPASVESAWVVFNGKATVNCKSAEDTSNRFYFGSEDICEETILIGESEEEINKSTAESSGHLTISAGEHRFPFRIDIPSFAPSSFRGKMGIIRYDIQGVVRMSDRSLCKSNPTLVSISHRVDVAEPHLLLPKRQEVQKIVSSFPWGSFPLTLAISVPKTGYCVGEEIPLRVSFVNGRSRSVYLTAAIEEQIVYTSQGASPVSNHSEETVVNIRSDAMASKSTHEWNPTIQVPVFAILDTHACQIIRLSYLLVVTAVVSQSHPERNLRAVLPLKLGYEEHLNTASQTAVPSKNAEASPINVQTPHPDTEDLEAKSNVIFNESSPLPSAPPPSLANNIPEAMATPLPSALLPSLAGLPSYEEAVSQCTHANHLL